MILIIDDQQAHVLPIITMYTWAEHPIEACVTRSYDRARQAIERARPDILILDINLTDNGKEGVKLAEYASGIGIKMIIAHSSYPKTAQRYLLEPFGVEHFVEKDDLAGLRRCIEHQCTCTAQR